MHVSGCAHEEAHVEGGLPHTSSETSILPLIGWLMLTSHWLVFTQPALSLVHFRCSHTLLVGSFCELRWRIICRETMQSKEPRTGTESCPACRGKKGKRARGGGPEPANPEHAEIC